METFFKKEKRKLLGQKVELGDVIRFKSIDTEFNEIDFTNLNKMTIFSIFPSINTRVCDFQTIQISKMAKEYPNLDFVAISLDLPTALKEWCGAHEIKNIKVMSDYKTREFGMKTGFLIDQIFLLNRGIIVLDENNKIIYISKNTDVHSQINFEKLEYFLKTVKEL